MFFLTAAVSGFTSGSTVAVTGNLYYSVVNNTGDCFTLTGVSTDGGGFCGTNPCYANLSKTLEPGVTQPVNIPASGDYIVLSYSIFDGEGACDQSTCNPSSSSSCSYYCGSCNSSYTGEFSITIPYGGGIGSNYNFSSSGTSVNPPPQVSYNAGTAAYSIYY